jgi:preprotein translocase subunit SecY
MIPIIPGLSGLAQEGEAGRAKISQYTHWATIPIALAQGYAQLVLLSSAGTLDPLFPYPGGSFLQTLAMVISLAAGTMLLVWIGELITENGIGNGISLIIFGGIVAGLPGMAGQGLLVGDPTGLLLFGIIGFAMLYVIVVFTEAQRRIPVQYGRSVQRGGRAERQGSQTHIPLRVNSAGMIPLIFSFSIMIFPGTVAGYFVNADNNVVAGIADFIQRVFFTTSPIYWILLFLLTVGFAFFYTLITFQQQNLAENLQQSGGFIPGIRPGPPTAQYLNRVIMRITWGGAIFLGAIAVVPFIATLITGVETLTLSSTALLIVVGVTLDTMRQLEAQLLMRQYEGFI